MDFDPSNISLEKASLLPVNNVGLTVIDVLTVVIGQPVMAMAMWITCTSSKPIDILSLNLDIFYNLHHWFCTVHLLFLYLLPWLQQVLLRFMYAFALTGGPLNLAFISTERYVAVIHPTSYRKLKQYRFREMCAASVWILSLTISFISTFLKNNLVVLGQGIMDNFPIAWMVTMTTVVAHSNISIAKALKQPGVGNCKLHPAKKKALKTVVATMHMVLLCYGSLSILIKIGPPLGDTLSNLYLFPLSLGLLSAASVAHPMYHVFSQGKLLKYLRHRGKGV